MKGKKTFIIFSRGISSYYFKARIVGTESEAKNKLREFVRKSRKDGTSYDYILTEVIGKESD